MHKLLGATVLAALFGIVSVPAAAQPERVCSEPECYAAGCWAVPGGRRCRRVCRRRCWTMPPRYVPPAPQYVPRYLPPPEPRYQPPYVPPVHQPAALQFHHALLLLGGAAALVVIIALITDATGRRRTALRIDADIQKTNELTAKLEAAARDADQHLAAAIARARHGGGHG